MRETERKKREERKSKFKEAGEKLKDQDGQV